MEGGPDRALADATNDAGSNNRDATIEGGGQMRDAASSDATLSSDANLDDGSTRADSGSFRAECQDVSTLATGDCDALYALLESTRGLESEWISSDPCQWTGVTCQNERVVEVRITHSNLRGSIPREVGQLTACQTLNLENNYLSGEVPKSIMNLPDDVMLGLRGYACLSTGDTELEAWLDARDPLWEHNGAGGSGYCLT